MMDAQALDVVQTQAMYLLGMFVIMSIISFFVSRRNATQYEESNPIEIRRAKLQEERALERAKNKRLPELSNLYNQGVINEREFRILHDNLDYIVR